MGDKAPYEPVVVEQLWYYNTGVLWVSYAAIVLFRPLGRCVMRYARTSPYHPIQIPIGPIIWSPWFVAMYGGQAVICKLSPPDPPGRMELAERQPGCPDPADPCVAAVDGALFLASVAGTGGTERTAAVRHQDRCGDSLHRGPRNAVRRHSAVADTAMPVISRTKRRIPPGLLALPAALSVSTPAFAHGLFDAHVLDRARCC